MVMDRYHNYCAGTMPHTLERLDQVPGLSTGDRERLQPAAGHFAFRANDYYAGLIDWADAEDPIRKIVVPQREELDEPAAPPAAETACPSGIPGLDHPFGDTATMLVSGACGGNCRFCFCKRLFLPGSHEVARDPGPALAYLRAHPEIVCVVLSGGDPLMLSTPRLGKILQRLRQIPHVREIRIGTKVPAFNPYRILLDPTLAEMLRAQIGEGQQIHLLTHFNHPRELTREAVVALAMMQEAGASVTNQTPLLRGINSDPAVLAALFARLAAVGVMPNEVLQCEATEGNRHFLLPLEQAYRVFEKARARCSGPARRARFMIWNATGKVEVVGRTRRQVFMRYQRAGDGKGMFMIFESNPRAYGFDEYLEALADALLAEQDEALTA